MTTLSFHLKCLNISPRLFSSQGISRFMHEDVLSGSYLWEGVEGRLSISKVRRELEAYGGRVVIEGLPGGGSLKTLRRQYVSRMEIRSGGLLGV